MCHVGRVNCFAHHPHRPLYRWSKKCDDTSAHPQPARVAVFSQQNEFDLQQPISANNRPAGTPFSERGGGEIPAGSLLLVSDLDRLATSRQETRGLRARGVRVLVAGLGGYVWLGSPVTETVLELHRLCRTYRGASNNYWH